MTELHGVMKAPCKSCPYRKDVPSGVWHEDEYDKLPTYDGEIIEQLVAGGTGIFLCHQQDNNLCAGWLACHGSDNLLAMRMQGHLVKEEVWGYETNVPLWGSGQEACDHGKADIDNPGAKASRVIDRLVDKLPGIELRKRS
jgi:hypothetical protein